MIREKLIAQRIGMSGKFRLRGHEVSRIEALSDAVFGFAITLLVVVLEVPQTFGSADHGCEFVALKISDVRSRI